MHTETHILYVIPYFKKFKALCCRFQWLTFVQGVRVVMELRYLSNWREYVERPKKMFLGRIDKSDLD